MDFSNSQPIQPLFINSVTPPYSGSDIRVTAAPSAPGSLTWVANLILYMPFVISAPYLVRRLFWSNGSTLTTSNVDMGVYTGDGEKVVSTGTTALSGASAQQYVEPAQPTWLNPGRFYFGYVCDNTTNRSFGMAPGVTLLRMCGVLQEAASSALLPTKMTPAAVANALYPVVGITSTPTGI